MKIEKMNTLAEFALQKVEIKNEIYFQGDKREKIISILESQGHSDKRIGG